MPHFKIVQDFFRKHALKDHSKHLKSNIIFKLTGFEL